MVRLIKLESQVLCRKRIISFAEFNSSLTPKYFSGIKRNGRHGHLETLEPICGFRP
jgi:hypothetical protein